MYPYNKIRLSRIQVRDEHRIVMERHLGRELSYKEIIHHKDRNKRNNEITNLEITNKRDHMKLHILNGEIPIGV